MTYFTVQRWPNDEFQHVVFTGSANQTYTLGDAKQTPGLGFEFKNQSTGVVTIQGAGSQTVDGAASFTLATKNASASVFSDGSNWNVVIHQESVGPVSSASVNRTGLNASITSTLLYAVPAGGAGLYRVTVDLVTTTAGTAGTVTGSVVSNNGSAAKTQVTGTTDLTALGNEVSTTFTLYSAASQNINYLTTVASVTGAPFYAARYRVEFLG
jgi:hypothetical protein